MKRFEAEDHFEYSDRLGIHIPDLKADWDDFSLEEQFAILYFWEMTRGKIPDRIFAFERDIAKLQQQLETEENFAVVCDLSWDIAERASCINDLQIYFRLNQNVAVKAHH